MTPTQEAAVKKFCAFEAKTLCQARCAIDAFSVTVGIAEKDRNALSAEIKNLEDFRKMQAEARASLTPPAVAAVKPSNPADSARAARAAKLAAYKALPCGKARADYLAAHEQEIWQAFREVSLQP